MMPSAIKRTVKIFGSGEMADLIRAFDWSTTPVGPIEDWPEVLIIAVNTMLATRHPMFLWWGEDLIQFYNDGYRPSIRSDKHPKALGQPGRECWPEIWHIIGPQIDGVMSRGQSTWHEDALVPIFRDGKLEDVYWTYSYSPVRDAHGVIRGTLVTCSETTGRVLAEAGLRSERSRLLNLFQQAPVFLAVLRGPNHVFELHNPPYGDLIGGRNVIGKSVRDALPETEAQGFISVLDGVYRTGEPFFAQSYPVDIQRSSGHPLERRFLDFVYQAMREPDGRISGIIVLGVDVTERKRAEDALRNTEKLAAVGRLAASIAHEINNPLEAVTNLIYLSLRLELSQQTRMYLEMAQNELKRVTAIATQTLRFHRQSTNAREVRLGDVVESALALFHGRISSAGVTVDSKYFTEKKVVVFEGDIRQVVANLLGNALDAMQSGGKIMVRVREVRDWKSEWNNTKTENNNRSDSQSKTESSSKTDSSSKTESNSQGDSNSTSHSKNGSDSGHHYVRLTIADTGSGMSQETQRHMFEPFFTTKSNTGTGLGLWVSAEILANHHARTRVRSSQDPQRHGTVISITFPQEMPVS
jgi:signal transduction histidine kinase